MNPDFTLHAAPRTRISIASILNGPTQETGQAAHTGAAMSHLSTDRIDLASSPHASAHYNSVTMNSSTMYEHQATLPVPPRRNGLDVLSNYYKVDTNLHRRAAANQFSAYLLNRRIALRDTTPKHLCEWALTPNRYGNLPDDQAFFAAQCLCKQAANDGLLDTGMANVIMTCSPPILSPESLYRDLTTQNLSPEEKEAKIMLSFQSGERRGHSRSGATNFLTFLHRRGKFLNQAIGQDLNDWASRPMATRVAEERLPNVEEFAAAKQLCILASQVGHIPPEAAWAISTCSQPTFSLTSLKNIIARSDLSPKQKDQHVLLSYQSTDKSKHRYGGARNFLKFLHENGKLLNEATDQDFNAWANTPSTKGHKPSRQAILGAKNLCALAREAGYFS